MGTNKASQFNLLKHLEDPLPKLDLIGDELIAARREWVCSELRDRGRENHLRVLISTNTLSDGGAEHQVLRLMPRLRELGFDVEHMYYHKPDVLFDKFRAKDLATCFIDKAALGSLKFIVRAASLMRKQEYDVVHAFMACTNIYIRAAAILAGRSIITIQP